MSCAFADPEAEILDRLVRIANRVPPSMELGYHFCYGDLGHRHFKEPEDAWKLVRLANQIAARLERPLNWMHFPVPRQRFDDDYYLPLAALTLRSETELLISAGAFYGRCRRSDSPNRDGEPALPRLRSGDRMWPGRRPANTIAPLLEIHAALAAPVMA